MQTGTGIVRDHLRQRGIGRPRHFRWRGEEVSRIEAFADAVFAFAMTLLVVALEVPKTYEELVGMWRQFIAFALCFAAFAHVWFEHYGYYRRFGLKDMRANLLTFALLFVVLFYVYPLKFLATYLVSLAVGIPYGGIHTLEQGANLMVIYNAGVIATSAVFVLLYAHALRQRDALELDAFELLDSRQRCTSHKVTLVIAVLSMLVALLGQPFFSGMIYMLMAPLHTWNGMRLGRAMRALEQQPAPETDGPH